MRSIVTRPGDGRVLVGPRYSWHPWTGLMRFEHYARLVCVSMAGIVLRVRLTSGDQLDVTYEEPDAVGEDEVIDQVVSALAEEAGVLRCRHGDRLLVLYARGVAAVEVGPRGAVL
jgi:hypothetical protein